MTLNSTGCPFNTLVVLGCSSIFSLGWKTWVCALLPVWNQTDTPWSIGPGLIGSTWTAITLSDPPGIVSIDQVRTEVPSTLAGGLLLSGRYFRPSGSSSRIRTCSASELPVLRMTRRTIAG